MRSPTTELRIEWLDGVRALAAAFVVLHHIWLMTFGGYPANNGPWWTDFLVYGHLAVAVFIVVSGFSLALGPSRRDFILKDRAMGFYRRRFWRIVPPYWAALAISSILVWSGLISTPSRSPLAVRDIAIHLLLLQDTVGNVPPNGTFWSIAIEAHIYVFFPLLLLLLRRFGALPVGAVVLGLVIAFHVAGDFIAALNFFDRYIPQFFALFTLGVLAVAMSRFSRLPFGWIGGILFGIFVVISGLVGPSVIVGAYFWVDLSVGLAVACIFASLATRPLRWTKRFLELRCLRFVGVSAYSLYLIHAPLLDILRVHILQPANLERWQAFLLMLMLGFPLAIAGAYGFFLIFERPFLAIRSWKDFQVAARATIQIFRTKLGSSDLSIGKRTAQEVRAPLGMALTGEYGDPTPPAGIERRPDESTQPPNAGREGAGNRRGAGA